MARPTGYYQRVQHALLSHPKLLRVPRDERLACAGAWLLALLWTGSQQTDGAVPGYVLEDMGVTPEARARLAAVGLWDEAEDGITFHDYADWQTTAAEAADKRKQTAERVARHRANHKPKNATDVTSYGSVSNAQEEVEEEKELVTNALATRASGNARLGSGHASEAQLTLLRDFKLLVEASDEDIAFEVDYASQLDSKDAWSYVKATRAETLAYLQTNAGADYLAPDRYALLSAEGRALYDARNRAQVTA